jgi:two-component system NtrC family sensor kinase
MKDPLDRERPSRLGDDHPTGYLETLQAVASAISGILELDKFLSTALDSAMELLDADKGAVHLMDTGGQQLALGSQRGLSPAYLAAHPFLEVGEQAAGRVADTRRPVLIGDASSAAQMLRAMKGEDFTSLVCVPLQSKSGFLGTVTLLRSREMDFDPTDVKILDIIAHQIAIGMESATLFAEKEHRVNELAALNEIAQAIGSTLDPVQVLKLVAQKTAKTCQVERCSILLLDRDKQTLVPMMSQFASGAVDGTLWETFKKYTYAEKVAEVPVMAEVVRQGKTIVLVGDSTSRLPSRWIEPFGIRSLLLVPLVTRDEIIGLIALDYTEEEREFSAQQVSLATTIGGQVAMAIENARLYEAQRHRATQLSVINQVGQRASSTLDLDELLHETAAAIREAFDYHFVSVLVVNEETHEVIQRADSGREEHMHIPGYRQSMDEGLIGWAVREGEALAINDVSQDPRYKEGWPEMPFTKSELVVPLWIHSQVVGALDIHSDELNAFDETDLVSIQTIADQVAVSMRNARLYEEKRSHLADLEAKNRLVVAIQKTGSTLARTLDMQQLLQNIVDGVVDGLGYKVAALGVIQPEEIKAGNVVVSGLSTAQLHGIERIADTQLSGLELVLEPHSGLVSEALSTDRILTTHRLQDLFVSILDETDSAAVQELIGIETIVAVPLVLEGRPLGALCAGTERTGLSTEELTSLRTLANQAILAMENARLYERTRSRLDELYTLRQISEAATSTLELNEILDRIVAALSDTLGFSNLALMLVDEEDQRLKITAGVGYPPEIVASIQPQVGEGVTGWVASTGEPLNVPDVNSEPRYVAGDDKVRSEVCVPLSVGSEIIGVLNVESNQPAAFSDDTVRFLATLAGQLAVIIENARLFQKVARGEQDWEDTFRAITDGIAIYDAESRVVRANSALADILDVPLESIVGQRCFELFSYCHGLTDPSCPHTQAMRTGEPAVIEVEEPDLRKVLHMECFPIFDAEGGSKGTVHTVRDITRDKALRAQLLQTEKLAAIGELVSGVAHELNNPLTSVMGYAQLLQTADVSKEIREDLQTIYQEAQRSAKIIENLLTFARKETAEKRYADINQILRDTLELRAYQFRVDDVNLAIELDEHLPWTMAAPQQLQQVFLNLLNNAHQAVMESPGPRRLVVRSGSDSDSVRVKIIDNGPGIPQEFLGKVFDPFFTTKDVGQGTGLGLSIAFGIVQEHGGRIWAESHLGEGSTFIVELPIVGHPVCSPGETPDQAETDLQPNRTILLIDDEEGILEVFGRMLNRMGHKAVAVTSAEIALDKLEKEDYDLIICDVKMPGLDGQGFYHQLREAKPELAKRVIFATGDTLSPATRAFLDSADTPHVSKPFKMEDLQKAIEDIIGDGGGS